VFLLIDVIGAGYQQQLHVEVGQVHLEAEPQFTLGHHYFGEVLVLDAKLHLFHFEFVYGAVLLDPKFPVYVLVTAGTACESDPMTDED